MKKYKKSKFSLDGLIENSKFNYCKNLKWFLIAPLLILVIGIAIFSTIGFNLGLDFTGGSTITIYSNSGGELKNQEGESITSYDIFGKESDYNSFKSVIENTLAEQGISGDISFQKTKINLEMDSIGVYISEGHAVIIQYQNIKEMSASEIAEKNSQINEALLEAFNIGSDYSKAVSVGDTITATASAELLMNAFLAMLVAVLLILIYIVFRFEFTSGFAAILALFHDLLITASLVLIFRTTINSSFIAALVTILGYSINNTIIIFDRIRENRKTGKFDGKPNEAIANASVRETMTRSIFTTLTTLITIGLVAVIGVPDIRDFAFPIVIGVAAGFYSSVFITPGLWSIAYRPRKNRKKAAQSSTVEA